MKRRILQLIPSFHIGGSEKQAVALTRMLREEGSFDVMAATMNNEGVLKGEFADGYPEKIPEYRLTSFFNVDFVKQVGSFSRYLRDSQVDLIHTHDFYTNVFGMAAASLAGTSIRITSKRESHGMRSPFQDLVEKIAFGRADAVLVNSEAVANFLHHRGVSIRKTRLIHNGVDLERFDKEDEERPDLASFGLPSFEGIRLVTLVANLRHSVKNVPMLIRSAKRVKDTYPHARFVIAGEGELREDLQRLALEHEVADRVHFIGRCNDVPSLLAASSVCVLTSMAEGFSNSLIEYMAAGKPVVATKVGGAAEAVQHGVTGYMVAPDDDKDMAEHLMRLLSDEIKLKEMGAKAKAVVHERFSLATQLSKTLELYNELLGKIRLPKTV